MRFIFSQRCEMERTAISYPNTRFVAPRRLRPVCPIAEVVKEE